MPFLAYYVVHDVTRLLMMFGLQLISSKSSGAYAYIRAHDAMISGVISLIDMLVGAFVLLLLMKHDEEELSIWDYVNLNGIGFYRTDRIHSAAFSWILILVQAVSMALGLNILIKLSGLMNISSYDATSGAQYSIPLWFGLFLYGLVSPAVEELLFRTVFWKNFLKVHIFLISAAVPEGIRKLSCRLAAELMRSMDRRLCAGLRQNIQAFRCIR